ncbi:hypothetical protein A9G11_02195 [Gilliamella sp. wkB108]|uniref:DUF7079 family protein n=1 Tax=Gilliamella sp. wkB108 TaxID=3120256 RepID=UPI00080DD208|nr:hypothetical protein [Gilliamella apicola]OCG25456.1 hypothetical protein A9G11_02195 [Gilliamella apicola]
MEHVLSEEKLYEALSDLFVDNEIDYKQIASVAKLFPINHVELVLFNYVAPVCFYNLTTPVPPVWQGFDSDYLINEINKIKKNENTYLGKMKIHMLSKYLRFKFSYEWKMLKKLL